MVHSTGSEHRSSKKRRGTKLAAEGENRDDSRQNRDEPTRGLFEPYKPEHVAAQQPESRGGHRAAATHHVPAPAAGPRHKAEAGPQPDTASPGSRLYVSRRKLLLTGGGLAAAFAGLEGMRHLASVPVRLSADPAHGHGAQAVTAKLSDIQFDLSAFASPALTINGVVVSFPPVYTLFAPARLSSTPTQDDQRQLSDALDEAVPSPTDVSPANPGITKVRFNVPVRIEQNDLLFTLRSDNVDNLWDVMAFLGGSNRLGGEHVPSPQLSSGLTFTSARVMFVQQGLPRSVADNNNLVFAPFVNPQSPMWMGFADQQVNASAPAQNVTF